MWKKVSRSRQLLFCWPSVLYRSASPTQSAQPSDMPLLTGPEKRSGMA